MSDDVISRVGVPTELVGRVKAALEEAIKTEGCAAQQMNYTDEHWVATAKTIAEIKSIIDALDRLSPNLEGEK